MIALINGSEGGSVSLFKGATALLLLTLLGDGNDGPAPVQDGTPLDLTGDTVTLEVYDTTTRKNAATKTLTATLATLPKVQGHASLTVAVADIDFGPGTYYAFVKRINDTGPTTEFSRKYTTIKVG